MGPLFAQPGLLPQISRTPGLPCLLATQIATPRAWIISPSLNQVRETAGYSQPTLRC